MFCTNLIKYFVLLSSGKTFMMRRYGLLGKKIKDAFGHTRSSILSGFISMPKPQNHGVPYSLTEEFVSVYRMHSMMPDNILLRDIHGNSSSSKTPPLLKEWVYKTLPLLKECVYRISYLVIISKLPFGP